MWNIMDKIKEIVTSLNSKLNGNKEDSNVTIPALCGLLVQLPEQLNSRLKSQFRRSIKDEDEVSAISIRKYKDLSPIFDVSLEKQLDAWKENPFWIEQPPHIKVTVPKGSLSHLTLDVNVGLPPDALYNIVTDPDNKRVFKNIKEVISRKVLVDEGTRQVVEVEQAALWRFLWWSGTISVHVLVDQNREDYTMKFKQLRAGFMKRFEGCWKMEPLLLDTELCHPLKPETVKDYVLYTKGKGRIGSKLSLEQIIEPAIVPPPPISWYLRGITTRTTEMLINDLLAEAARIRGFSSNENTIEHVISEKIYDKFQLDELGDIKERWTMRRKISRQSSKRLLLATKIQGIREVDNPSQQAISLFLGTAGNTQLSTGGSGSMSSHRSNPLQHRSSHLASQIDGQCYQTLGCRHQGTVRCTQKIIGSPDEFDIYSHQPVKCTVLIHKRWMPPFLRLWCGPKRNVCWTAGAVTVLRVTRIEKTQGVRVLYSIQWLADL